MRTSTDKADCTLRYSGSVRFCAIHEPNQNLLHAHECSSEADANDADHLNVVEAHTSSQRE